MYEHVTAVVPHGSGMGFTLAGVRVREVKDEHEAFDAVTEAIGDNENGVVLVDEEYALKYPQRLQKLIDHTIIPFVVSIPVIHRWEYGRDRAEAVGEMIRRAVGYRVKLTE